MFIYCMASLKLNTYTKYHIRGMQWITIRFGWMRMWYSALCGGLQNVCEYMHESVIICSYYLCLLPKPVLHSFSIYLFRFVLIVEDWNVLYVILWVAMSSVKMKRRPKFYQICLIAILWLRYCVKPNHRPVVGNVLNSQNKFERHFVLFLIGVIVFY